ncbi:PIG-L family deacetylase [candidate division KSB1 bacterium]|nr:MAG: PIG-L family deacetylase [candidate division KSB1 bacterium]
MKTRTLLSQIVLCTLVFFISALADDDGKLRIIVFGAHPDDCELKAGGMAAMWAAQGHHVKFVSTTNGDIGHATMAGGPLARRREAEVKAAAQVLGIETEVLDIHDGELMPTMENRATFVRLIREWRADIVMGHRPNDYHPDHRYTGVLMQDAAFMVTVAHYLPTVPYLKKNPVFLFLSDNFQKPYPFTPNVVADIDAAFEQKIRAIWNLESQIESLWATGDFEGVVPVPADGPARDERFQQVRQRFYNRDARIADHYRDLLIAQYGADRGGKIKTAEAFELCEYGRQPSKDELLRMFLIK